MTMGEYTDIVLSKIKGVKHLNKQVVLSFSFAESSYNFIASLLPNRTFTKHFFVGQYDFMDCSKRVFMTR